MKGIELEQVLKNKEGLYIKQRFDCVKTDDLTGDINQAHVLIKQSFVEIRNLRELINDNELEVIDTIYIPHGIRFDLTNMKGIEVKTLSDTVKVDKEDPELLDIFDKFVSEEGTVKVNNELYNVDKIISIKPIY